MDNCEKSCLHYCICRAGKKIENLLEHLKHQGKPEAMIMQEREVRAQRTQADHSRRESLMSSSSQEHTVPGKPETFFKKNSNTLIHQMLEDLFLKEIKIFCSVRQDLNL